MAFVRCLPAELVGTLAADAAFVLEGWQVAAVRDTADPAARCITADQAVEWREDKADAALLLIDPQRAGAGMDGIYSAAREIGESELFDLAVELARQRLPHGCKGFALKALFKAGWKKRRRPLAPWSALAYLGRAAEDAQVVGTALPMIGLWPIAITDRPSETDLDHAAVLVERLLPAQGARIAPEQRVAALNLDAGQEVTAVRLVGLLREVDGLPRMQALQRIALEQDLWLNHLRPGLFDQQTLQGIRIQSWRQRKGDPYRWSGLVPNPDGELELRLSLASDDGHNQARLEVRWTAEPEGLAPGAATYQVEVHAGQNVLAERSVSHAGKSAEKAVFSQDDFDLDENARFQAQVRITPLGDAACEPAESEGFILCFGDASRGPATSSAGKIAATLSLAAIQVVPDWDTFRQLAKQPGDPACFETDKKGFILCKWQGKVAKVFCPPLFRQLSEDWIARNGALGRWRLRVREDGAPVGSPEFVPMGDSDATEPLAAASGELAAWLKPTQGPLGVLYLVDELKQVDRYVDAAARLWQTGDPELTLIQTLEVQSLAGRCLGLIVLPTHPLRIAWQQGFDLMVAYHRYNVGNAERLTPQRIADILKPVTGAHYPAFLPGLEPGRTFVFGDTLGFHAAAMVAADDPEPKATLALLGRLLGGEAATAPSVGDGAADALAGELGRYLQLHPLYRRIRVHALRAGDAMPVARALGKALRAVAADDETADDGDDTHCFELELFPGAGQSSAQTGRFLSATAERRRSGAGAVPEEDRWLLQSVTRPGGVSLPRLRWARRNRDRPQTAAHVAIAFDVFNSRVECRDLAALPADGGVLEAHGLMLIPSREFHAGATPHWLSYIPPKPKGDLHPFPPKLTKRQVDLHSKVLRATARHLGGGDAAWPVLITEVSPEQADLLADLHHLCDWVMTADRNAGMEYFDSPHELPTVYDAYVIDCVPERDDLGFMQLITSTSNLDEVVGLLDTALGDMGLSASPRNCRSLLDALKAVSGRLALRLAGAGTTTQQMIAIALVQGQCSRAAVDHPVWPALAEGFLIPVDDVPELFRKPAKPGQEGDERADLLYVTAGADGGLAATFIEVKFRRYLKTARAADLVAAMERQLEASCQRWHGLFGARTSTLEQTVNRAWLARILRFYAKKGRRHGLTAAAYTRLMREIDRFLVRKEIDLPDLLDLRRLGFVFCPEYGGAQPARIEQLGHADLWLFGAGMLPEPGLASADGGPGDPGDPEAPINDVAREGIAAVVGWQENTAAAPTGTALSADEASALSDSQLHEGAPGSHADTEPDDPTEEPPSPAAVIQPAAGAPPVGEASVLLGHQHPGDDPLYWHPIIQANPHLMILGLPGMGKTTSLINTCIQLDAQGVTPIVFSYHEDIDEKLALHLPQQPLVVRYAGLGFNPMEVVGDGPVAYLDNAGMLRDIFAAIFPDLGDVQLGRLRDALKQSYLDQGWAPGQRGETPAFHTFLERLRTEDKPDKGLLTRLSELDDYGLFATVPGTGAPTLLDQTRPALIQIHGTQNDYLQRAFATFVLYNLYQGMFRRGVQRRITHAVIFDEAHRAARLKLLATMVKECRKYGIAFVVASQEAKDFDPSLFTAIANYLALRLNDADAKLIAKTFAASDRVALYADRIKQMKKYHAMYYGEGLRAPILVALGQYQTPNHPEDAVG
jgi:hypothetical protein